MANKVLKNFCFMNTVMVCVIFRISDIEYVLVFDLVAKLSFGKNFAYSAFGACFMTWCFMFQSWFFFFPE